MESISGDVETPRRTGDRDSVIVRSVLSPDLLSFARPIAEAQLDLVRIRRVRHDLLSKALSDPAYEFLASTKRKIKLAAALARTHGATSPVPSWALKMIFEKPSGPEKFGVILSDMARKLAAIDRYERRAISRRNSAIRIFDSARRRAHAEWGEVLNLLGIWRGASFA